MSITPSELWNLTELARVTVDGDEYVIIGDSTYSYAMRADSYEEETDHTDYSAWCGDIGAVSDMALARAILGASVDTDQYHGHMVCAGSVRAVDLRVDGYTDLGRGGRVEWHPSKAAL